jgi:hypothetical protein
VACSPADTAASKTTGSQTRRHAGPFSSSRFTPRSRWDAESALRGPPDSDVFSRRAGTHAQSWHAQRRERLACNCHQLPAVGCRHHSYRARDHRRGFPNEATLAPAPAPPTPRRPNPATTACPRRHTTGSRAATPRTARASSARQPACDSRWLSPPRATVAANVLRARVLRPVVIEVPEVPRRARLNRVPTPRTTHVAPVNQPLPLPA